MTKLISLLHETLKPLNFSLTRITYNYLPFGISSSFWRRHFPWTSSASTVSGQLDIYRASPKMLVMRKQRRMSQRTRYSVRGTKSALSCYRVVVMPDRRRCHPKPKRDMEKNGARRCGTKDRSEYNFKHDYKLLAISSRRDTWCLRLFLLFSARCWILSYPVKGTPSRKTHNQLKIFRFHFWYVLREISWLITVQRKNEACTVHSSTTCLRFTGIQCSMCLFRGLPMVRYGNLSICVESFKYIDAVPLKESVKIQ